MSKISSDEQKSIREAINALRCAISDLQTARAEDEPRHIECAQSDIRYANDLLYKF